MKMQRRSIVILILLSGLVLVGAVLAAPVATTLERYVIGSGGGQTQAGTYTLQGTLGQPVVGTNSRTPYDLCSGYWCGLGAEFIPPSHYVYLPLGIHHSP
jgi:hypothetical protein